MKSDEFIREVNEELQQDKMKALWNLYGAYIIGAAVLIVAGTAGTVGWQSYQNSQMQAQGELRAEATAALHRGESDEAIELFGQLGQQYGAGPGAVAAFGEAAALVRSGDAAAASDRLALLGNQSDVDTALADLAKLKSAQLRLDSDDPAALIDELEPLAAAGAPFSLAAREALAIAAIRVGDMERAEEALRSIVDDAFTSDGLQSRATELLFAIGGRLDAPGGDEEAADTDGEVAQ